MLNIGEFVKVASSDQYGRVVSFRKYGKRGEEKYMYSVSPIGRNASYPFNRDELIYINPMDLIDVALINRNETEFRSLLKQFGNELFQNGGKRK